MAHQLRGKRVVNYDVVNVIDMDGECEELSTDIDTPITERTHEHRHVSHTESLTPAEYKDPLKTFTVHDPFGQNKTTKNSHFDPKLTHNSSEIISRAVDHNSTQSNLTRLYAKPGGDVKSTLNDLQVADTTASREASTTPLNQRNPVTSIQITKRYISTPRPKKNQKGFGHDEKDLVIDDIEDF